MHASAHIYFMEMFINKLNFQCKILPQALQFYMLDFKIFKGFEVAHFFA